MPDLFDLINTLAFGPRPQGDEPRGLSAPSPLAGLLGPGAQVASAIAPGLGDRLAQFAAVPGPPRDAGEMVQRLMQIASGAGTLGEAPGILATAPLFARQAQIANMPGLANIPVPGVAGNIAASVAPLSLLPGGQQVASALGVPEPTMGYGDVLGPAYAASAQQGGGLSGLGAALDQLAATWHATPEVIPATKFAAANALNPLTYAGGGAGVTAMGGPAAALIGRPAVAATEALNLPFTAAKRTLGALPVLGQLSDASVITRAARAREDLLRGLQAHLDAAGLRTPDIMGKTAQDPRLQAAVSLRAATAEAPEDAALLAQNAAQAAEASAAARTNVEATLASPTQAPPAATVETSPAAVAGAPGVSAAAPALPSLNWFNNRAQAAYRMAQEAYTAVLGHAPPPASDLNLTNLRTQLDREDQADSWLAGVLGNIQREGIRPGRAVEQTEAQGRRASFLRGLGGGVGGQTSARTGELIFEPDTVGQVAFATKRLQDRGLLPPGENVRLATTLRWAEDQYGSVFPAPPPGEQTYWAAIQAHMDTLAGKPPTPPGAAPEVAAAAAAPTPPEVGTPSGGAPPSPGGAAAEPSLLSTPPAAPPPSAAGEALAGPEAVATPGAPAGTGPAASPVADDATLLAREEALGQALRALPETAPGVPDPTRDAVMAELAKIRRQRIGPPTSNPITPPEQFAPPSAGPLGPPIDLEGTMAKPPPTYDPALGIRDPEATYNLQRAQEYQRLVNRESTDPNERADAARAVQEAAARVEAGYAEALPSHAQVLTGELANQIATARNVFADLVPPGRMGEVTEFGGQLGTAIDKLVPDLERAQQLRTAAGLGPEATLRDTISALKSQGSELVGEAQTIDKAWRSDILTGDLNHILTQHTLGDYAKARGLNEHAFQGPEGFRNVMNGLAGAWRAQALVSVAFHVKNTADSVLRTFVDSGKPGFLADARPWAPGDLANLIKTAWQASGGHDPTSALSPQLRVWGAIHDLPMNEAMFSAPNPTLQQALNVLSPMDRDAVMSSLSPVERAVMQVDPTLGVPSAIAEAVGPLETGGWLSKVPLVDRGLALNLRLTMGIEQSARGAKFIDAYKAGIDQGLPKAEAYQQGIAEANRLFFDYQGDLTNLDRLMRNVFAFHVFATRNLNFWAPVLASNPILIKALAGYEQWSNQQAEEGGYTANRRFAESVKFPVVGGIGGAIAQTLFGRQGQIFWNPIAYLAIAEQTLTTPQDYRDEPPLGQALSKARTVGLGLAPWWDIPLGMAGAYGARGPQSVTGVDSLLNSAAQTFLGRPTELPWQTIQRIRPPGQATPASLDIAVRQRLGEMSLEERPDFVQVSPAQPIHPDFVRAMAEGPSNPLYEEAARSLGVERLVGTLAGKVVGGGPAFQSELAGRMARAEGNPPRGPDVTRGQARAYQAQQAARLTPEDVPLITARREIGVKTLNEPGSQPAGEPPESMPAYIARVWPTASPARQWALLQSADPATQEAIAQYLGRRVHLHTPGRG